LLSDRGFHSSNVIRPDDLKMKTHNLRGLRAIIENVFSNAGVCRFKIIRDKLNYSPEYSALIIRACYQLTTLLNNSLRKE
jgi:isocitrate dehydrogenase kinase/phosphatase